MDFMLATDSSQNYASKSGLLFELVKPGGKFCLNVDKTHQNLPNHNWRVFTKVDLITDLAQQGSRIINKT